VVFAQLCNLLTHKRRKSAKKRWGKSAKLAKKSAKKAEISGVKVSEKWVKRRKKCKNRNNSLSQITGIL